MTITRFDEGVRGPVEAGSMPDVEMTQDAAVVPERGGVVDLAALLDDEAVAVLAEAARAQAADGGPKLLRCRRWPGPSPSARLLSS
jgi:hypothetical protein